MKKLIKRFVTSKFQKIRIILFRLLSSNSNISGNPIIKQPVQFVGRGKINFGNRVQIGYFPLPFFFSGYSYLEARNEDAEIIFGNRVIANNNLIVGAESGKITFGDDVLIGANVEIINSDYHNIDPLKRNSGSHKSKDVTIGNNVFIGSNVKILKGVTVGDNSIISNGSVVYENVPRNSIVRGNPAQLFKEIIS